MNFYLIKICMTVCICLNLVNANTIPKVPEQDLKDIVVVNDIHEFVKEHPSLKLNLLKKITTNTKSETVRYKLGARVTDDRLVAQGADVFAYPAQKDVTVQLTYPESGSSSGSVVTYVEIVCTQDNTDGNAYIIAGGIGQRFISIILEANQTENFSYNAQYFGKD